MQHHQDSMGDIDRLRAAFSQGSLLHPISDVPNILDLARTLAAMAGAATQPAPGTRALAALIGPAEHLIFIMADGLGMNFIESLGRATFLASHLATEMRSIFPSTTSTVLTTLATCDWPARHGVTGWWTHLPTIGAAALLPFQSRSTGGDLAGLGLTPEQAFPAASLLGTFGRETLAVMPQKIARSAYSNYFRGGQPVRGYRTMREALDLAGRHTLTATAPSYTYVYLPQVDETAHRFGAASPPVAGVLEEMDAGLRRLHAEIRGRARLVVSADHGFLDTPADRKHSIGPSDTLLRHLRHPPSGDARVLYLHVRPGAEDDVRDHFRRRYGERFMLVTTAEAEEAELLGPGRAASPARQRLGDLMAISAGEDVIEYCPAGRPAWIMRQASHHSGLTPAEMRVPLILA